MFNFRDMTIGRKVGLGFGVIILFLLGVVLLTIQQVKTMEIVTKRVVDLRTPTTEGWACQRSSCASEGTSGSVTGLTPTGDLTRSLELGARELGSVESWSRHPSPPFTSEYGDAIDRGSGEVIGTGLLGT